MGKVSEVEISGHQYRYEYVDGKTLYRGPVGDAPALTQEEFGEMFLKKKDIGPKWTKEEQEKFESVDEWDTPTPRDKYHVMKRDPDGTVYLSMRWRDKDGVVQELLHRVHDSVHRMDVGGYVEWNNISRTFDVYSELSYRDIKHKPIDKWAYTRFREAKELSEWEIKHRNNWLESKMRDEGFNVINISPDKGRLSKKDIKSLNRVLKAAMDHGYESQQYGIEADRLYEDLSTDKANKIYEMVDKIRYEEVEDVPGKDLKWVFRVHKSVNDQAGDFFDVPYDYIEKRYPKGLSR